MCCQAKKKDELNVAAICGVPVFFVICVSLLERQDCSQLLTLTFLNIKLCVSVCVGGIMLRVRVCFV